MKLIQTILGGGGSTARSLALASLLALLAAALLAIAPAAADGHPDDIELVLSIADDSDDIVPAGSEITINASLRFTMQPPIAPPAALPSFTAYSLDVPAASVAASNLRISGDLEWDSAGRRRLDIAAHSPLNSDVPWPPTTNQLMVKGLDGRTLIARDNNTRIHIYDSYTLEYKVTLAPPPGSDTHLNRGFGASVAWDSARGAWYGKAIAVWHETDARAWLFVGSWGDTVASRTHMGRLFIYRLDWDGDSVTATQEGTLTPPRSEVDNRHGASGARYGAAVDISRDGGTLAVSATRMNEMGAVYVYTRPDGAGEDWGDITYADGVKVTAGAVPSWGRNTGEMPFDPNTAYSASNPRSCDDWCALVYSQIAGPYDGSDFGVQRVSLSADGSVLLVGAGEKDYPVTRPFSTSNRVDNAGEAFVWVAPAGGWQNALRADLDADGNAKTLIAAQTDARSFRRATHYSPGPLRRVTEPAAVLVQSDWPSPGNNYFGLDTAISPDGSTAVVSGHSAHIFQRDSASDWASVNGGYLTPTATLAGTSDPENATMQFSFDGSELAIGLPLYSSPAYRVGAIRVFSRPDDGTWASDAESRLVQETGQERDGGARYGNVVPELTGPRVAIGTQSRGRNYLTTRTARRCTTTRTAEGAIAASCPVSLPNPTITIPDGTPDGPFTIAGIVSLQLGSGDPVTLRDTLEVTVGDVDELAQVEFDFDTNAATGRPQPAVVAPGGSTTLLLKLLNENGKASAKGAAASVLVTTTRGALSGRLGSASGEACDAGGGQACRITNPTTALTASNADQIRLTMTHPGAAKAGAAQVRAVVVGATGEAFETEPLTVTFSGPPTALAISQPATALLGYDPTESADQRNAAALVVSAADANGNKAAVPDTRYSAKLTDSDNKTVAASKAGVVWPLRVGGAADGALLLRDGNPQARVTIAAGRSAPLAAGEYTLELSVGSGANKLTATQTINITGGAAEVALSADPAGAIALDDTVTLTATVTDSSGLPVPDGTPVTFAEQSTAANVTLVLLSQAEQRTRDGRASASLRAVGVGGAYVTAEADGISDARSVTVAAPPPPSLDAAVGSLAVDAFSIWTGPRATTASELYDALDGVARVSKWDGAEWVSYGETDGLLNSGSIDFAVERGTVLWLAGE